MTKTQDNRGFTVLEIAIGLLVLGLLATPAIQLYRLAVVERTLKQSDGHLIIIQSALQKFALRNGRYPVPAAFNLGPGVADFGREYTGAINACAMGMDTVCRAIGERDVILPAGNDPVLIGSVPFAALGLPLRYARDGYAHKFTYAVTESMIAAASFVDDQGAVRVVDRANTDTPGTAANAHYALVAHGKDGKGAFNLTGTLSTPCTAAGTDTNNCNNDAIFNNNFDYMGTAPFIEYKRYEATAAGAQHYDDYVRFSTTTTGDTWTQTANAPDIYSRNNGNIRIGPGPAPTAKIEVMGNLRATRLRTTQLCVYGGCDAAGPVAGLAVPAWPPLVFKPDIIGGTPNTANANRPGGGISCGDMGLTGIGLSDEECAYNRFPVGMPLGTTCPAGQWARGTNAAGELNCVTP